MVYSLTLDFQRETDREIKMGMGREMKGGKEKDECGDREKP